MAIETYIDSSAVAHTHTLWLESHFSQSVCRFEGSKVKGLRGQGGRYNKLMEKDESVRVGRRK